jgi:hypothetical protein
MKEKLMSHYVLESKEVQVERIRYRVEVVPDEDACCHSDPILDCYGKNEERLHITYRKSSRYTLGTDPVDDEEWQELNERGLRGEIVSLPVYAYVHSGMMIKAGTSNPFGCPWDSGMSGIVYVTQEFIKESWPSGADLKTVHDFLKSVVNEYSEYLQGNYYGYIVYRLFDDGGEEEIDSCWGFLGDSKYCLESGVDVARSHGKYDWEERQKAWRKALKETREKHYWFARDVQTV